MDPILVLNADHRTWMIRIAAYNVVIADEKRQADENGRG